MTICACLVNRDLRIANAIQIPNVESIYKPILELNILKKDRFNSNLAQKTTLHQSRRFRCYKITHLSHLDLLLCHKL